MEIARIRIRFVKFWILVRSLVCLGSISRLPKLNYFGSLSLVCLQNEVKGILGVFVFFFFRRLLTDRDIWDVG